jgi:hypothetical protein
VQRIFSESLLEQELIRNLDRPKILTHELNYVLVLDFALVLPKHDTDNKRFIGV